jgi:hypothetical protein
LLDIREVEFKHCKFLVAVKNAKFCWFIVLQQMVIAKATFPKVQKHEAGQSANIEEFTIVLEQEYGYILLQHLNIA